MKALPLLPLLSLALAFASADASVVINFNQAKPTENIVAFNDPVGGTRANLNWISTTGTPDRIVAEVFTVGNGGAPAYLVDSITMKLADVPLGFANSGFSVTFYELSSPSSPQSSWGKPIDTFTGNLLTTAGATASYFTFDLGGTVELQAGKTYSYALRWDEVKTTQGLLLEYSSLNDGQGKIWYTTNPSGPTWISINNTAVFYVHGQAIPEGRTVLLGAAGLITLAFAARHRRTE